MDLKLELAAKWHGCLKIHGVPRNTWNWEARLAGADMALVNRVTYRTVCGQVHVTTCDQKSGYALYGKATGQFELVAEVELRDRRQVYLKAAPVLCLPPLLTQQVYDRGRRPHLGKGGSLRGSSLGPGRPVKSR